MFVTGLNKEIRYKAQDLEPRTLVRAIEFALIHKRSSNTNKLSGVFLALNPNLFKKG